VSREITLHCWEMGPHISNGMCSLQLRELKRQEGNM